jgi:hypothetical protein
VQILIEFTLANSEGGAFSSPKAADLATSFKNTSAES